MLNCLPGGLLHTQWEKWRDLQSKDAVKMSLAALAGMGISTANVPALAVAATVFLLNVVAKIGIEAVCEGCAEEEAARDKARKKAADDEFNKQ
jgi:pyridoxine 5'-phosphate synthase PdxJ